jgi:hypothetical protein
MNLLKIIFISLLPAGKLIFIVSGYYPHFTENVYSSFICKILGQIISRITGLFPFSLAEFVIIVAAVFVIIYIIKTIFSIIKTRRKGKTIKKFILNILAAGGIMYFSFLFLWGINYNRLTLSEVLDLNVESPTQQELNALCEDLIRRSNSLRTRIDRNGGGVLRLPYDKTIALKTAYKGFENIALLHPNLDGKYGSPKGLMLSELVCYTGITGFFFPFTGESNVNMAIPDPFFPCTVTHEMAHQRGIAREDEANYIAYLACINHPDVYFQYSGTLMALNYSIGALARSDRQKYDELMPTLSKGVINDLNFNKQFWSRYSGLIERASDKINDTYLKAQRQKKGVRSYGAVVDLLIAEYRKNKI